jgi:membrane protease YdiL (CAAX protease family)
VAALAAVEFLLTASVPAAAVGYGLLALALCLAQPLVADEHGAALLPVLLAIPVLRLITLAAPGAEVTPPVRLAVLAVPAAVAVALAARDRPADWRLLRCGPGGWRIQAAIALVAVPLAVPLYLLAPSTAAPPGHLPLLVAVALLVLAVIPDEVLFRGLLVPAIAGVAGRLGVPLAAAAYAATFLGYGALSVLVAAYGLGLVLAWLRQRTGSALGVLGARILLILLIYLVLPTFGL